MSRVSIIRYVGVSWVCRPHVAGLLLLACVLYIVMLAALIGMPGGDPGGYGGEGRLAAALSELYTLVVGGLLWITLAGLLTIGAINGEMPRWAMIVRCTSFVPPANRTTGA